jgi:hypothetical protein
VLLLQCFGVIGRAEDAPRLIVTLHGLPVTFASAFGFDLLAAA